MAFTAVTAIVAGTAEVTAALVLTAVAEVGMALSVVGAITGSEDLLKIGSVMGLVGGVGGMIAGAVNGGAAAAATGVESMESAAAMADAAYGGTAAAEASQLAGIESMGGLESLGGGIVAPTTEAATTLAAPEALSVPELAPQATPAASTMEATAPVPQTDIAAGPTGAQAPQGPAGAQAPTSPADANWQSGVTDPYTRQQLGLENGMESSGGFFSRFSTFAEKNKTLFSGGLQLLGGAMKGMNDRSMFDEKMDLQRQELALKSHGNEVGLFAPRGIVAGGAR